MLTQAIDFRHDQIKKKKTGNLKYIECLQIINHIKGKNIGANIKYWGNIVEYKNNEN